MISTTNSPPIVSFGQVPVDVLRAKARLRLLKRRTGKRHKGWRGSAGCAVRKVKPKLNRARMAPVGEIAKRVRVLETNFLPVLI